MTWFRLGGPARWLCRPRDAEELARLVRRARDAEVPLKVLGGGANVLISDDGFDGVVVRLDQPSFRQVQRGGHSVRAGAGVDLMRFSKECSEAGLSGLECMAGIPGSVGGAVRMNAGGRFGDIGGAVREVEVLHSDGRLERRTSEQMGFGYRQSNLDDAIALSVTFELSESDPEATKGRFEEIFSFKTASQPLSAKSAGCIFKNPPGSSAGALIDRAGLKGARRGGASVSTRHANFIVAEVGARSSDVLFLIDLIRERVAREFDTALEVEVDIWRGAREGVLV